MANTKKYLSHLLQNTGITPACSEEERAAADVIAKIFSDHGFAPEVQEFSASGSAKVVQAGLGIAVFVGSVLAGIGGPAGIVGLLLAVAAAVLFVLERSGRPVLSNLGSGGLSQNVIAYHKATGPLASPRNRPVVVVAHYDSPRADLLSSEPFAAYRPLIVKLLPACMVAPAIFAIVRVLPLPDPAKVVLWVLAIVAALIPLANGIAIIANRFFLPYTTGAVCNKSSVAAMLGVMDAVAPYEMGEEFPSDQPADEYFAEQQRILEEAIAAAEATAAAQASYPHEMEEGTEDELTVEGAESEQPEQSEGEDTAEEVDFGSTSTMNAAELEAGMTAVNLAEADPVDEGVDVEGVVVEEEPVEQGTAVFEIVESDHTAVVNVESAEEAPVNEPAAEQVVANELPEDELGQVELDLDVAAEDEPPFRVNSEGNIRFGADVIRALGMMPESCSFVYESDAPAASVVVPAPEFAEHEPIEAEESAPVAIEEVAEEHIDDAEEAFVEEDVLESADEVEDDAAFAEAFAPVEEDDYILEAEYEVIEEEPLAKNAETESEPEAEVDQSEVEQPETGDDGSQNDSFDSGADMEDVTDPDVASASDDDVPAFEDTFVAPSPNGSVEEASAGGATQMFTMPAEESSVDLSGTVAMPAQPVETVDSLMAEVNRAVPARPQRVINVPSTASAPKPRTPETANRASLFDLPDPSATPVDPFAAPTAAPAPAAPSVTAPVLDEQAAEARSAFTVISSPAPFEQGYAPEGAFETISAPAPEPEKPRRGLSRLFGRKKKDEDSMSDWLGVDDSFDAKRSGHDIGSWDNFDDDDWKGGAAPFGDASEEELREAIADMGDDELLGHDIWFVATGASENGNAGMQAFLDAHRDKLRGVFLINLESVGAGQVAMLSTEGEERVLKGDKRITKLVQRVSSDFHHEYPTVDMPYVTTDAQVAMNMSLRSLTIGGVEGTGFALARTEEDQPYNVDLENVAVVSDVVTEVIRRS